jgi:hypothetical protein
MWNDSLTVAPRSAHARALVSPIARNVQSEIHSVVGVLGTYANSVDFASGSPGTIQKLEEGTTAKLYCFDEQLHRVTAVFLHHEGGEGDIPTFLDVRRVWRLPVQTSSTEIRRALEDRCRWQKLCTLPFVALVSICGKSLYRLRACEELLEELNPLVRHAVEAQKSSWVGHEKSLSGIRRGVEQIHANEAR